MSDDTVSLAKEIRDVLYEWGVCEAYDVDQEPVPSLVRLLRSKVSEVELRERDSGRFINDVIDATRLLNECEGNCANCLPRLNDAVHVLREHSAKNRTEKP